MACTTHRLSRRELLGTGAAFAAGAAIAARPTGASSEPLFDAHAHLVSPDTGRYPQVPADNPGAAVNLPAQEFRQFGKARPIPQAEHMVDWMKAAGVGAMAAVQKRGTYGVDNRYILDSAARFPEIFYPVVVLDAQDEATPALVEQLAARRLAGVRLTGVSGPDHSFAWLASDKAQRVWAIAAETGIVIDIMTMPFGHPPDALKTYADIAARFPGVRMVIDHLNWPAARGAPDFGIGPLKDAVGRHANVFFKFTTINIDKLQDARLSPGAFLAHAVETFGKDRLLWGTDMGNTPGTYRELVARGRAAAASLSPEARRAVMHDTGRSLFARRAPSLMARSQQPSPQPTALSDDDLAE